MKRQLTLLITIAFIINICLLNKASANIIFSTEEDGTEAKSFVIDNIDASADKIILKFGDAINKYFEYDKVNQWFNLNGRLNINFGTDGVKLTITATSNDESTGNVNQMEIRNQAGNPVLSIDEDGDLTTSGNLDGRDVSADGLTLDSIDTVLERVTSINNSAQIIDDDNIASTIARDSEVHTQNTDTGSTTNTYTLDNDNTGGDVILKFGQTLAKVLKWDNTNSQFDLNDDLNITGNLTINGNVDGRDVSSDGSKLDAIDTVSERVALLNASAEIIDDNNIASTIARSAELHTQNTDTGTNQNSYIIDNDNSETTQTLSFGSALSKKLSFDVTNNWFNLSNRLNIAGDGTVNGVKITTRAGSGDSNQSQIEIRNNANSSVFSVNESGNVSVSGTVDGRDVSTDGSTLDSIDTVAERVASINASAQIIDDDNIASSIARDSELHTQNTDTSTTNTTFTLDSDNTGTGVNTDIISEQGTGNNGTIRYNSSTGKWQISNNGGSFNDISTGTTNVSLGSYYMEGNSTITYCSQNIAIKAAGTTTAGTLQDFTHSNNKLTYTGSTTKNFLININATLLSTTNDIDAGIILYKNGSKVFPKIMGQAGAGSGKQGNPSISRIVSLATNDYIEVYVINDENDDNLTLKNLSVTILSTN